jgi:hypothetical protein
MFSKFTKKRMAVLAGVLVVALAGIAYAFWSGAGGGSGTGSVDNPTTNNKLTVHGTLANSLAPGGNSSISFTVDNAYSGSLRLGTIHLSSVAVDDPQLTAGCDAALAQITMGNVVVNKDIPAGNANVISDTGTVSMGAANNQDACKGATFTLTFTNS